MSDAPRSDRARVASTRRGLRSSSGHHASVVWRGGRAGAVALSLLLCVTLASTACTPAREPESAARPPGVTVIEHWQKLAKIEDSLERTAAMAAFVTTLGPEDVAEVEALATGMFWRHRSIDHLILMNTWFRFDPEAAMEVAALSRGSTAMAARADGVREWASRDPQAVAGQVSLQESAVQRALVRGWYESGQPGLSDFILEDAASKSGQNLMASYAEELGFYEGADGIEEWMDSVRAQPGVPPLVVKHVHRKGIVEMAVYDAERAIAYCDRHCEQPYADAARIRLASRLGILGHAPRALEWIEASTDANAEDRGRAGAAAFGYLLRADEQAAFAWADEKFAQYAGEPWIEPIVSYAITARNRSDPSGSLAWVDNLPEGKVKREVLIGIGRHWLRIDPEAADEWLDSSPLDEAGRAEARRPLKWVEARPQRVPGL